MRPDCKAFLPLDANLGEGSCKFQPRRNSVPELEPQPRIPSLDSRPEGAKIFSAYNPLYSFAGFLVGALVGLTGVGGGSLMTPLLVLLFGFHPATAVGTDLLYASVTKTVGTAAHGTRQTVACRIVRGLACGSVPASILTLLTMYELR